MTELKEAVFGKQESQEKPEQPTVDTIKESDDELDTVADSLDSPEDLYISSMNVTQQLKIELEQEAHKIDEGFTPTSKIQSASLPKVTVKKPAKTRSYTVGVLSGAVSLIFMGIVLTRSLASPIGPYAAIKLSPLILVFLGIDFLYGFIRHKGKKLRIGLASIIIVSSLIILTAVLSAISVKSTVDGSDRLYAQERIQNMIAGELRDKIAHDNVKNVDIEIKLYGENAAQYETPADLTDGDIINLKIHFFDAQMPIREFAKDCREILDGVLSLRYNFGTIDFIADDSINVYTLNVDCLYQSGFNADKLATMVNFFGDRISDTDIPDLADETE